jgi:hypothetical protein
MTNRVGLACETTIQTIAIAQILPVRVIAKGLKTTGKYRQIATSIREVGIIEPIVVHRQPGPAGQFLLLDGHVRLEILKDTGATHAQCLVARDDEAFTYNHKVSRVAPIQEHFMIMKAIRSGVSEQAIATALDVDVARIRKKRDMLVGICPEAIELLKGRRAGASLFAQLRKAKPMRQIEMVELMSASNNFSVDYAKCLLAATPVDQLIEREASSKNATGLAPADIARMERELASLSKDFKLVEESYGKNVLNLVIVVGYLKKLLDNGRVVRYLSQHYPELLAEFQKIVESRSFEETVEPVR